MGYAMLKYPPPNFHLVHGAEFLLFLADFLVGVDHKMQRGPFWTKVGESWRSKVNPIPTHVRCPKTLELFFRWAMTHDIVIIQNHIAKNIQNLFQSGSGENCGIRCPSIPNWSVHLVLLLEVLLFQFFHGHLVRSFSVQPMSLAQDGEIGIDKTRKLWKTNFLTRKKKGKWVKHIVQKSEAPVYSLIQNPDAAVGGCFLTWIIWVAFTRLRLVNI